MSKHYSQSNGKDWDAAGLKDYGDFAECVEFVNQEEYGDGQLEGEWFYVDVPNRTIYSGTFGNYNSPGASHYTYAEVYGEDEAEQFVTDIAEWEAKEEYIDTDDEEADDEEEQTESEEGDWVTDDHRNWTQYNQRSVLTVGEDEDWRQVLRQRMEADQFWPNVWWCSDHGNWHPLSMEVEK